MKMKKKGDGGGGANWMDTYGDMVTLLLCFFVLLYSMSTISEENWKAIVMSFNPDADMVDPHVTPEGGTGPNADANEGEGGPMTPPSSQQAAVDEDIEELFQALQNYIAQEGVQSDISVVKEGGMVFISFNDTVFFGGDSAELRAESYPVLDAVSTMLSDAADSIHEIQILGHTAQSRDNEPNIVAVDRTLSSQRAANVLIYIQDNSTVDPARMLSVGVGQWRPVASNIGEENKRKNRRVEMIISGRDIEEELAGNMTTYVTTEDGLATTTTAPTGTAGGQAAS